MSAIDRSALESRSLAPGDLLAGPGQSVPDELRVFPT